MKNRLLSSAAVTAIAAFGLNAPAQAQSRATPYSWSGFYVGLNAGHAWGNSDAKTSTDCSLAGQPPGYNCVVGDTQNAALFTSAGSGSIDAKGFTGGIQFGHNWQMDRFVYGVEVDYGAFRLNSSRQAGDTYISLGLGGANFSVASTTSTDWLATVRGRVGMTLPSYNLLAYATGGLAWTRLTVTNAYSDNALGGVGSGGGTANALKQGFAVGGGLEWACGTHWTVKGEYLYVDFGKVTASGTFATTFGGGYTQGFSTTSDLTAHVARVGINYKF